MLGGLRDLGDFTDNTFLEGAFLAGGMQEHYTRDKNTGR